MNILDLDSLAEFAELRCSRILSDIADDKMKAFPIEPMDYSLFNYSNGIFYCPFINFTK